MKYSSVEEIVRDIQQHPVESNGDIYHPIPFPEFSRLRVASNQAQVQKKWALIRETAREAVGTLEGASVLDIGANGGFYSFNFASLGAKVTAFEAHPRYAAIGSYLAKARAPEKVDWHSKPFEGRDIADKRFDVALMLSVFQWMAEGGPRLSEATDHLRAVSERSRYLFFELGYNRGNSHLKTSRMNHYGALIDFLRTNTAYKHFRLVGKTRLWRFNVRFLVLCSNDGRFEDTGLRAGLQRLPL